MIIHGNSTVVLKDIKADTIHLTFTSPPYYNAKDYSQYKSYEEYLDTMEKIFTQVHRVTQEGRFLVVNTSPVITPRLSRGHSSKRHPIPFDLHNRLARIGWEFVDDIIWLKPEASVKNRIGGFTQHRKPLGYKPNCITEYLMVYRKKTDKLIDWNMKQYPSDIIKNSKVLGDFDTSNVWTVKPIYNKMHPAVFPKELCDKIIKYYSYIGDTVLDPFAGSGTVGKSAKELGRGFILVEQKKEYYEYICNNLFLS